jgi:hypothetical protein
MGSVRLTATRYIWVSFAIVMALTFSDVALYGNSPGIGHIIVAAIVASGALIGTGFIWNWGTLQIDDALEETEKSKRRHSRRLDRMLDRLSEDELDDLRDRLNADADPGYLLTADGELEKRR